MRRWACLLLTGLLLIGVSEIAPRLSAQTKSAAAKAKNKPRSKPTKKLKKPVEQEFAPGVRNYVSDNFLVHTDLSDTEAQELLERLETMLALISAYWNKPNAQTIEMYVVQDASVWPQSAIPPEGWRSIHNGGGLTVNRTRELIAASGERAVVEAKAVVYAIADRGTPQHEAVHAYCGQNFGRTGPTWYSEGMA